jgi:4,5-DOPA dioxygenase extradiol
MTKPLPAIFFGHGNPMNALQYNEWTQAWTTIGATLPHPRAILCVSAHWYLPATLVTAAPAPRTIHDFGGFPRELYQVQYPAPGSPEVARRVQEVLAPLAVDLDHAWGLDHGTWSVLRHVYSTAEIPVLQLSIDETQPAAFHFEVGTRLGPLRDEGILIMGSGNLVHNLHTYAWGRQIPEPFDWAVRFETAAKNLMVNGEFEPLINYESLGRDALLSIPTPDHYLPLLYVLGTRRKNEAITFPVEGVDGGSISMLAVQVG